MKNKFIASFLSISLTVGMLPASVSADSETETGTLRDGIVSENTDSSTAAMAGEEVAISKDAADCEVVDKINSASTCSETGYTDGNLETDHSEPGEKPSESEFPKGSGNTEAGETLEDAEDFEEIEEILEVEDAEENGLKEREKREIELPDPGTVTGFEVLSAEDSSITVSSHVSLEELTAAMPDTIGVYLDNSIELVEIPVTWVSDPDYETTNEQYFTFWASWDQEDYPLSPAYDLEQYVPFIDVTVGSPEVCYGSADSVGVRNILSRAMQMVNIRWTPLTDVNGFYSSTDQLTIYKAGKTYNGIPYGQQVTGGTWVPNSTSFDTFLNAVKNLSSPFYTARGSYYDYNSTYYANDCSSFVSYCYGLSRHTTSSIAYSDKFTRVPGNSIYNAQPGDCLNWAGVHVEIITGMNFDSAGNLVSVEISEQTPPKARTVIYTPAQAQRLINQGYTLLRFNGRDSVAAPVNYSGYSADAQVEKKVVYSAEADSVMNISNTGSSLQIRVEGLEYYSGAVYKAALWSSEGGQDDLVWVKLTRQTDASYTGSVNLSSFRHGGPYVCHLYKMDGAESLALKKAEFGSSGLQTTVKPVTQTAAEVHADSVEVTKLNNTNGSCRILVRGVSCDSGVMNVKVPVWSQADQSDIVWYDAKKLDATTWYADVSIANHDEHMGTYNVHVYGTNNQGKMNYLGNTKVTLIADTEVKAESVEICKLDNSKGTCRVVVKGVSCDTGVKRIQIPVWSQADQSDIVWYEAKKLDATSWYADVNIANHKNNYGNYSVHVYGTNTAGNMNYMGHTSVEFVQPPASVSAAVDDTTVKLTVTGAYLPQGIKKVMIPVWSATNGQDDLVWNVASYNAETRTATLTINSDDYKHYGAYIAHVYAEDPSGHLNYLGKTDFSVAEPVRNEISCSFNNASGDFTVEVDHPYASQGAVTQLLVATWSDPAQKDLIWYHAVKQADGSYCIAGNVSSHKGYGSYNCHIYAKAGNEMVFLGKTEFTAELKMDAFSIGKTQDGSSYPITVKGLESPVPFKKVTAAVWSEKNGQDDLVWYDLTGSAGHYTGSILVKNHQTIGTYNIHLYGVTENGEYVFIGKKVKTISTSANAVVISSDPVKSDGKVNLIIQIRDEDWKVTELRVPVWSAPDQSDIVWYKARAREDGTWTVTVDNNNHRNNTGLFQVHVYATYVNGIMGYVGRFTVVIS